MRNPKYVRLFSIPTPIQVLIAKKCQTFSHIAIINRCGTFHFPYYSFSAKVTYRIYGFIAFKSY